jgi:MFS family permease
MIARTETPERWAGFYWITIVSGQLLMALSFVWIIPRFGTEGGFAALGLTALLGLPAAAYTPDFYGDLPVSPDESGAPPLRGWWALFATLLYTAASGAVLVYLQPMSHEAGLSADVARTALWVSLAAQVGGGFLATALAGRVHWFTVFCISTVLFISGWIALTLHPPAWLFIAANGWVGLVIVLIGPFLVPMTIEADPSRRTAMQSGATQLLAGALGPLLASFIVNDQDVYGAVWLGTGLILSGLILMGALHVTALRARKKLQPA